MGFVLIHSLAVFINSGSVKIGLGLLCLNGGPQYNTAASI